MEATERIREEEMKHNLQPIPIIGLSGNARNEFIEAARAIGMTDYIVKPYQKGDLYSKLLSVPQRRG